MKRALRWLAYLLFLGGMALFYVNYNGWISLYVLIMAALLPVFSVLVSLPRALWLRFELEAPRAITAGGEGNVTLRISRGSAELRLKLRETDLMGGKSEKISLILEKSDPAELNIPSLHCGAYSYAVSRAYIDDLLGLFRVSVRRAPGATVYVFPNEVIPEPKPDIDAIGGKALVPKPGGGFSENHENRAYRPGDPINSIHWKLTAKSDELIVREPQETRHGAALITLSLTDNRAENDYSLGALLWLSEKLIDAGIRHTAACSCASGVIKESIGTSAELSLYMRSLLSASGGESDTAALSGYDWVYRIDPKGRGESA